MSKNLDTRRLAKLVRWTIITDRQYEIRAFWMYLALTCFILQFDNIIFSLEGNIKAGFSDGCIIAIIVGLLAGGGAYFFSSFYYWNDGIRELCMLPASRLEKFLVRCLCPWLVQLLAFGVSLLAADALQYLTGLILGREPLYWATSHALAHFHLGSIHGTTLFVIIALILWSNTLFALGANLFRNVKYSSIFTMLFLLVLFVGAIALLPATPYQMGHALGMMVKQWGPPIGTALLVLSAVNIAASYRLFGQRPIIGRFINTL